MSETGSPRHPQRRRTDPIKVPVGSALELLRTDMVILAACLFSLLSLTIALLLLSRKRLMTVLLLFWG